MVRRFLTALLGIFFCGVVYGAQIVNVEYIHALINQEWGITVPYHPELKNPRVAANMKYLLTAVDAANRILNDEVTTHYGTGPYATTVAVDTVATIQAVRTLIQPDVPEYTVFFTPSSTSNEFYFEIAASGTFYVDWGDGTTNRYKPTDTSPVKYSHSYASAAKNYTIGLGGRHVQYNDDDLIASITFNNIQTISGDLSAVFPSRLRQDSLGTSYYDQPSFYRTFYNCTALTSIPETLFHGITGTARPHMFDGTFRGCSKLSAIPENLFATLNTRPRHYLFNDTFRDCASIKSIPENLFAGVHGAPANATFYSTFRGCKGVTGAIPSGLFRGIVGAPAQYVFSNTFHDCTGLTGDIPVDLFAGISGAPDKYMFNSTFRGCTRLTGIGGPLFAKINGAAQPFMYANTFYGCTRLTGKIPENLFGTLSGRPQENMFNYTFYNDSKLVGPIPKGLFGMISGAPAVNMYRGTFYYCSSLVGEIPDDLFGAVSGVPADGMYGETFYQCSGLSSEIPLGLFGDLFGPIQPNMFYQTFYSADGIHGPSARNPDGTYLYQIWSSSEDDDTMAFDSMYHGTNVTDWASIPEVWRR